MNVLQKSYGVHRPSKLSPNFVVTARSVRIGATIDNEIIIYEDHTQRRTSSLIDDSSSGADA